MKLAPSWTHGLTCLFWLGSTVLAVLTLLGNYSGAPALKSLSLFRIDKNTDSLLVHDRYTVGIFGTCGYTKQSNSYKLDGCNSDRIPYYFDLKDILANSSDDSKFQTLKSYQTTFQTCMKAAWALLIVFIGINGVGLLLALIGIKWSSFCREAAVQLGVVNLLVILTTGILVTVSVKHAVSKFNADHQLASAHFGGGGIVMVWVLWAFCYLCFAFITVLVKRRNVEVHNEKRQMNYDINSENTIEEGLSTPQVKAADGFGSNYSPSSTLKGTPRNNNGNKLPMPSPVITRPFTPENNRMQSPQSPSSPYSSYGGSIHGGSNGSGSYRSSSYGYAANGYANGDQQRKVSNNSIYTRTTTPLHQQYAYQTPTSPNNVRVSSNQSRVSSNGARHAPNIPAQYQHHRVARLNDTRRG